VKEREINAINSEFSMNVHNDLRREYQIMLLSFFNTEHPVRSFGCGNRKSLSHVSRELIVEFYNSWYSANLMKLSIIGKESLDDLERMVRGIFTNVVNRNIQIPKGHEFGHPAFIQNRQMALNAVSKANPYLDDKTIQLIPSLIDMKKLVYVAPVTERRYIIFQWVLPGQRNLWRTKPVGNIDHLMNQEGHGSLIHTLRNRGLATNVSTRLEFDNAGHSVYRISIGMDQQDIEGESTQIAWLLASYIRMIEMEFNETIWRELETIDRLRFHTAFPLDPIQTVRDVANSLHWHPVEQVLAAKYLHYDYDEEQIKRHLGMLNSSQMSIMIVGKKFEHLCTQTEKWFGAKYGVYEIPRKILQAMQKIETMSPEEFKTLIRINQLRMPTPNPFLPDKLDMLSPSPLDDTTPRLISTTPQTALFYKQSTRFGIPTVMARFAIYYPDKGLRSSVIVSIFADILVDNLSGLGHAAEVSGSGFRMITEQGRVILEVYGFNVGTILDQLLDKIKTIEISKKIFDLARKRYSYNAQLERPYAQASEAINQLLYRTYYTEFDQFEEVWKIEFHQPIGGLETILGPGNRLMLESLVEGNLSAQDAYNLHAAVAGAVGIFPGGRIWPSTVGSGSILMKLDRDIRIKKKGSNPNEKNGAVIVSVETGWVATHVEESDQADLDTSAYLALASRIIEQRFYSSLRTQQQLGYIVQVSRNYQSSRAGLNFLVQSESPTALVEEKIMEFISQIPELVISLPNDDYYKYVAAVVNYFDSKPRTISDEFSVDWTELDRRRFDFERTSRIIPVIKSITKEKLALYTFERIVRAPKVIAAIAGSGEADFVDTSSREELQNIKSSPRTRWVFSNTNPIKTYACEFV
jgi:insulysin